MPLSRLTFIYACAFFLLLPFQELHDGLVVTIQSGACILAILTFGISHGAIDNILFRQKVKVSDTHFILIYLLVMIGTALMWFLSPEFSLLLFLAISAYHFGQSQLDDFNISQKLKGLLYFFWGTALLTVFIYLNQNEILTLIQSHKALQSTFFTQFLDWSGYFALGSVLVTFGALVRETLSGNIPVNKLIEESYVFALLTLSFALFNVLVGFSLYFIILHSMKVLSVEYSFLKSKKLTKNLTHFIRLLVPFTGFSLVGLMLIGTGIYLFDIKISIPLLALIIVSCVTLPHSVVMNIFYQYKSVK